MVAGFGWGVRDVGHYLGDLDQNSSMAELGGASDGQFGELRMAAMSGTAWCGTQGFVGLTGVAINSSTVHSTLY